MVTATVGGRRLHTMMTGRWSEFLWPGAVSAANAMLHLALITGRVCGMTTNPTLAAGTTTATTATTTTGRVCANSDCYGQECDYWDTSRILSLRYDCLQLEWTHGCDCTGCACPNTIFPTTVPTTLAANTTTVHATTSAPVANTGAPDPFEGLNVCSDGTVSNVCLGDMEVDELVALFALPTLWTLTFVAAGSTKKIVECRAVAAQRAREAGNGKKGRKSSTGRRKVCRRSMP
jgi:hypothetical protein